jgi:serine phosphatase RsbU (regulator of sigma subunit)
MLSRFILFIFLTFHSLSLYSQELGRLPFRNFSHKDYSGHFQNWAVAKDQRGIIYVGNNTSGVLEYDGSEWISIPVTNGIARCLDIDKQGRIWVGGQNEFGYISPDSLGLMKYNSLTHLVPSDCMPFGLVRQVFATDNGILFSTNNCIFLLNGDNISTWFPKTFFHRTYFVNGKIFSIQPEVGLTVLTGDTLTLAPFGEKFANTRIYAMMPYDENRALIATQSDGFFLYDLSAISSGNKNVVQDDILKPFHTSNDKFFSDNWVYHGLKLPNGWFAFGTYRGGAAVFNQNGVIQQYIGKGQGIQDETVWHIGYDDQDNIWLALNSGISYSALISPVSTWDASLGVQGVLQTVKRHKDILYISTNAGVFFLEEGKLQRLNGIVDLSWDIVSIKTSDATNHGLIATGTGVYYIDKGKANLIDQGKVSTFHIVQSAFDKDIVYLGLYDGIGVASYSNGKWKYLGKIDGTSGRIKSIVEDKERNLWFVSPEKGIVRARIENPRQLSFDTIYEQSEIPNQINIDEDCQLLMLNGKVLLSTPKGLFHFNPNRRIFIPDNSLGEEFGDGSKGIKTFLFDSFGYLWFESYKETHVRKIERAFLNDEGRFIRLPSELNAIPSMIFYSVHTDSDGITWIAGSDGLYRIDPNVDKHGIKIPSVLLRKIYAGSNNLLFGGAFREKCSDGDQYCLSISQTTQSTPNISYSSNTISFHFSAPFFGQEERMKYAYKLNGFDENWSDWTNNKYKEYTNLPYGSYTFQVKSLSVFDVESPITSYSFVIIRPWYNSPFIYVIYLILIVLIILLSVSIKTKMLRASNIRLQNLVEERTREIFIQQQNILDKNKELVQQKEEIEAQRDELDFQNKQTKASIQYALTIQQAILPEKTTLDKYFENFILFQPKDLVSGDFYWFSHLPSKVGEFEKLFIAIVDCTGHGVPGAFMSMIGSRMLSEIINERRIYDPASVLTELDKMLKIVLHQDSSENFDGMDVCLCSIDQVKKGHYLVSFAGANRPLSYHRKGTEELGLIKGNRKSIGSVLPDIDPIFETQLIDLKSGDTLFLYSDGYTDQNDEFKKKFTTSKFLSLINSNLDRPMGQIGNVLSSALHSFMGDTSQRDDITVLGIRLK